MTMSKIALSVFLAGSLLFTHSTSAFAQSENESTTPPSKWGQIPAAPPAIGARSGVDDSYDARALRIESHWGTRHIVRGAEGPIVGKVGVFRSADVEKIVAGSPRATTEARIFRSNHRSGAIASALGGLTFAVGLVASTNSSSNAATPILMIGGIGAVVWGAKKLDTAYSALSRAVWWHNRDLSRTP